MAHDGLLVGDRDVRAERVGLAQPFDQRGQRVGRGVPGFVARVEAERVEGGLLKAGRDAVRDGASDHADAGAHWALHCSMLAWCSS